MKTQPVISDLHPKKLLNRGLIKAADAARQFEVPGSSLSSAIARGHIPGVKSVHGRKAYWVKPEDVEKWLEEKYRPNLKTKQVHIPFDEVGEPEVEVESAPGEPPFDSAFNPPVYLYENHEIRAGMHNGEPVFCVADICAALELKKTHGAIQSLREHGQDVLLLRLNTTLAEGSNPNAGNPNAAFTNLSGVNFLVFRSRKPAALKLQKWVTKEVLPSIYRTGSYSIAGDSMGLLHSMVSQMRQNAEAMEETFGQLKVANKRLDALEDGSFKAAQDLGELTEEQKAFKKILASLKKEIRVLKEIPEFEESLLKADQSNLRALSNRIVKSLAGARSYEIKALYPNEDEPPPRLMWWYIYKALLHAKGTGNIDLRQRKKNALKAGKKVSALSLANPKELSRVFVTVLLTCERFDYRPTWFNHEPLVAQFFELRDARKQNNKLFN